MKYEMCMYISIRYLFFYIGIITAGSEISTDEIDTLISNTGYTMTTTMFSTVPMVTSTSITGSTVHNSTTMYPITTGLCACFCDGITADINTTTEPTTMYVTADLDLVQMLKVNQEQLSSEVRKKTSASDYRTSSTIIGSFGVLILVFVISFIVLLDCLPPNRFCTTNKSKNRSKLKLKNRKPFFSKKKNILDRIC